MNTCSDAWSAFRATLPLKVKPATLKNFQIAFYTGFMFAVHATSQTTKLTNEARAELFKNLNEEQRIFSESLTTKTQKAKHENL